MVLVMVMVFTGALGQVGNSDDVDDDDHYRHGVGDGDGVHRRTWTGWCG